MKYDVTISKVNRYRVDAESASEAKAEAVAQWNSETRNCFFDDIEIEQSEDE